MRGMTWLAWGLMAFGGCSLAGAWSHRERLATVPRMTCEQLIRNGPRAEGVVTLTDVRVCRHGHVGWRDGLHPGDFTLYVPVYPAHLPQEPQPRDLVLVLEIHDDDAREALLGRPDVVEFTCQVHADARRVEDWARRGLAAKYPGLPLVNVRVLTIGLHEPSPFVAYRMTQAGVVTLAAGGVLLACLGWLHLARGRRPTVAAPGN